MMTDNNNKTVLAMTTTIPIAILYMTITITMFERGANLFGERGEFDAVHEIVALLSPNIENDISDIL